MQVYFSLEGTERVLFAEKSGPFDHDDHLDFQCEATTS